MIDKTHFELWFKKPTASFLDRAIFWRDRRFTHVELVLVTEVFPLEGEIYTAFSADGNVGGTRSTLIPWEESKWERVKIPCIKANTPEFTMVYQWVHKHLNTPYDYLSLVEILLGKTPSDMRSYNCSQFCTYALRQAGLFEFVNPETITPGDLWLCSKTLEEIYEKRSWT